MENSSQTSKKKQLKSDPPYNAFEPDVTPRREGGEGAIAETSPLDSKADEIVFPNQQKENPSSLIPDNKEEPDK